MRWPLRRRRMTLHALHNQCEGIAAPADGRYFCRIHDAHSRVAAAYIPAFLVTDLARQPVGRVVATSTDSESYPVVLLDSQRAAWRWLASRPPASSSAQQW